MAAPQLSETIPLTVHIQSLEASFGYKTLISMNNFKLKNDFVKITFW